MTQSGPRLSQAIDIVKNYMRGFERRLLDRQFKLKYYVHVKRSVLQLNMGESVEDVCLGIDRIGQEWHLCIQYFENVRGKRLRRVYAVENMSAYCLLDAFNTSREFESAYDAQVDMLTTLYFEAAASCVG